MKYTVEVYNESKYNRESVVVAEAHYSDVVKFEVVTMSDEQVFALGFDEVDEYGEY